MAGVRRDNTGGVRHATRTPAIFLVPRFARKGQ